MQRIQVASLIATVILTADVGLAQDDLLDEPRRIEQITFSPPTSASIRLTNGIRRTGKIVSISRESVVYQVGRDNNEVSAEIDDIRRINTLDNEFTYTPATEDFERLKIKARRVSYLSVQTVETYVPPPDGVEQPDPPAVPDPAPASNPPAFNEPPVPPSTPEELPEMRPEREPAGAAQQADTSDPPVVADVPDDEPQPGDLILFCSNCNNRLPLSIKNGDECPHCGLYFDNFGPPAAGSSRPQVAQGGGGIAGQGGGAYPSVTAAGQTGEAAAPDQPAQGGGQVTTRGLGLSDVPVWMQVGFFIGMLVIGWLLLQRR